MGVLGTGERRLEGLGKVTGGTRFTSDLALQNLAHARVVLSTHASGRIETVDLSAAREVPGVLAILTGEDLTEVSGGGPDLPLARERVYYAGQPVIAVVGETEQAAADAAALVAVDYAPLPAVLDPLEAIQEGAPEVLPEVESAAEDAGAHGSAGGGEEGGERAPNVSAQVRFHRGDPGRALAECAHVVEERYHLPAVHQGFLEPHVAIARWEPEGTVTVWTPTQGQFLARKSIAKAIGIRESDVRVVPMPVGGGFGGKVTLLEPLLALLSRRLRRPVRLELTRTEEFLMGRGAPSCTIQVRLGADAEGRLRGLAADVVFDDGAGPGGLGGLCASLLAGTYRIADYDVLARDVCTNKTPVAAYRAPGAPQAYFALESAMDTLAEKLGQDPIELRLRNASREGDLRADGTPWPRIGFVECLEEARQHPLYTAPVGPGEGVGVAAGSWGGGREPAAAGCRVESDGTLTVLVGHQDISGTDTTMAMIAAETFGVSMDRVRVEKGDSANSPYAGMAGGSKITYTVGPAVVKATADARQQLLEIASEELEASIEDLEIVDGRVQVKGVPARSREVGALAELGARFGGKYPPVHGHGRNAVVVQSPMFTVHICRVRFDAATGGYDLTGYAAIQDVGRALNPPEVESQVHGGSLQGVARALGEELVVNEDGQLLTASFVDYAMPSIDQVPPLDVRLIEIPSPVGPFGAKGVGEPPAVPGPAALANAVARASGVRPTRLPIEMAMLAR
ncbi:MAG: xanthine dehydrogenase family protein molybdopterin-binding subunit [Candidatus Dormibacteraceae bacterium]